MIIAAIKKVKSDFKVAPMVSDRDDLRERL
jgi:hypothetical protein